MGLFRHTPKDGDGETARVRLTDPAMLRRKGELGRAAVLDIETAPSAGATTADPAYMCTLTLEVHVEGADPFRIRVLQRMSRSTLGLLQGPGVTAAAWVDPKDRSRVAVDVAAGPIERQGESLSAG